ncbi:MAG: glycosyltransferase [Butyrivibrio sp.]|nr:glycosyltransferase [Butyrivibrio sp.]
MLKSFVKGVLIKGRKKNYINKVKIAKASYDRWEKEQEKFGSRKIIEVNASGSRVDLSTKVIPYSKVWEETGIPPQADNILIFVSPKGKLSKNAVNDIKRFFINNPDINVVYGDEDELAQGGKFTHPYFKPEWSPDTYLNAFYIGSVFACRANIHEQAQNEYENAIRMLGGTSGVKKNSPEAFGLEASMLSADVLFCMLAIHERAFGKRIGDRFPIGHMDSILFHRNPEQDVFYGRAFHNSKHMLLRDAMVNIIIPSKDNADVLRACIESIVKTVNDKNLRYDITIVDNGSSAFNRVKLGTFLNTVPRTNGLTNIQYLYKVEDFNFSHMCNRGAQRTKGEYLLFLNDDIEAVKEGWLREMLSQAQLGHVGIVGAKLLYPDSDIIQHAGITSVRLGPVHKLQRMHDKKAHYFGFNRGIHNLIGATGACLMIARSKYEEVGGFPEVLPVAFNDVDLCFSVHEAGYYNLCCNHVYLYHHESLSRGIDNQDPKKMERLASEYDVLMKRHPRMYNYDPFYSQYLTDDETIAAIIPKEDFTLAEDIGYHKVQVHDNGYPEARQDEVVRVGVEFSGSLEKWNYGIRGGECEDGYFVKGYSFVIGSDNSFFERRLVLRQVEKAEASSNPVSERIYSFPVYDWYRPDIKVRLSDQVNVDLTGYKVRIRKGDLPVGYYQLGILAIDKTSTLKLINWVPNIMSIQK